MQGSLVFLILGVGRLREDQLIYVETRENVFLDGDRRKSADLYVPTKQGTQMRTQAGGKMVSSNQKVY